MSKVVQKMPEKQRLNVPASKYLPYLDGRVHMFTHKECPKKAVQKMRVALYRLAKARDMVAVVRVNDEGVFVQATPKP